MSALLPDSSALPPALTMEAVGSPTDREGSSPADPPASTGPEDKIRKDLVQVFFGLVLTQIAVYVSSLVRIWSPDSLNYWAAWTHIILAFGLTTASWFGWQMAVKKARLHDEASVFQSGFVLSLLDILLVTLYFLLVHLIEMKGVAAFPPLADPVLDEPDAWAETSIFIVVFLIYVVWDTSSYILKETEYGPGSSILCLGLSFAALLPVSQVAPTRPEDVLWIDAYLFGVVFLFRALRRMQKWRIEVPSTATSSGGIGTTLSVFGWVIFFSVWCLITYIIAIMPLGSRWISGQANN